MAKVGEVIENPKTHQVIVFRETAESTDGKTFLMEFTMKPEAFIVGGEHIHPNHVESFKVLTGRVKFSINGVQKEVKAGDDEVVVQPGTKHVWWNDSGVESKVLCRFRPAKRYESYFETIFGLARDGKTDDKGFPHPLQAAVIYHDFRASVQPGNGALRALLKVLLPIVAPLGKLFGYRSTYPKYTDQSGTADNGHSHTHPHSHSH